ncbi:MAG TPA: ATP-binding protein [Candidatus Binatia bacterium]
MEVGLTAAAHIGVSAALTTITSAALGCFVLVKNSRSSVYRIFALYCLSIACWSAFLALHVFTEAPLSSGFTRKYLDVGALLIPVFFVHFISEILGDRRRIGNRLLLAGLYVVAAGLVFLCIQTDFISDRGSVPLDSAGFRNSGFIYVAAFALVCSVWGLARLVVEYIHASGLRKIQVKYLLAGSALGCIGGIATFSYLYQASIYPFLVYGTYAIPIYVSITAYAIGEYRLLDINVVFKKSLVHGFLLLVLLTPCYVLFITGERAAFGKVDYIFSILTLLLFIVIAFLFPKVRFRTEEALERVLFQRRANYRETLLRSSREMVSIVDLEPLCTSLVKTVAAALGAQTAALYLLDEHKGNYSLKAAAGSEGDTHPAAPLARDDPLLHLLKARQEAVVREELEIAAEDSTTRAVERMKDVEAEISVPITSKQKLVGILNLGRKQDSEIYGREEIELLSTLANQAAIAIENARLYENLKQSQNTIRRADRLSSLGLLTAGLAHEIRNPLVAIRTFTQLLPERYDDAEFREGFQGLALKEVDRICGLINDLLSFARPSRPNIAEEDMNDVVDGIARILETEAKEKGVQIKREFATNLPKAWIDREQLKQVFMNLILNAIQAIRDGGSIVIATRSHSTDQQGQPGRFVQVEIRDTGMGIPEENLEHIFDPFFTSKDEGSGLGLSISHQIVQEHGGFILVQSKVGEGTSFLINLPADKPARSAFETRIKAA